MGRTVEGSILEGESIQKEDCIIKGILLTGTVTGMLCLLSCTAPNVSITSWVKDGYQFKSSDKIAIVTSDEPSPEELQWISHVKNALLSSGYEVVESPSLADKALLISLHKNVRFSTNDLRFVRTYEVGALDPAKDTIDIGSSSLMLTIYVAYMLKEDGCYPIWSGHLCTSNDLLYKYPEELIKLILKNYGKTASEFRDFRSR